MKKFILGLMALMLLVSCTIGGNPYNGNVYNITFISNGEILELDLNRYVAGSTTTLPVLEDTESDEFVGWYQTPGFTTNKVETISTEVYGDLTFYAKWQKIEHDDPIIVPTKNELEQALTNLDSFKYTFKYSDNDTSADYSYESDYEYFNGSIKTAYEYDGLTYVDYLMYDQNSDSYTYYGQDDDGSYYVVNDDDEFFEYYIMYFDFIDLSVIKAEYYTEVNGNYQVKQEFLTEQADGILSGTVDGETYNSLEINVLDKVLSSIVITSTIVSDEYGTYDAKYEIILSDFGKVNFTAPDDSIEPEVTLSSISTNRSSVTVLNGTSLEAVMESIIVYKHYSNGSSEQALASEYSYQCANYDSYTDGTYEVTIILEDFKTTLLVIITNNTTPPSNEITKPSGTVTTLQSLSESLGITRGMPSTGNSKALIIPVAFTDALAEPTIKKDLETTFFGTSEETGWESLSSYYAKASYGKLNITGDVLDVFNTGKSTSYYNNLYKKGQDADYEIIKAALEYYDPQINYADYDSDQDGYIDALYIIYTCPVDYDSDDSLWWAYTYEYVTDDYEYYDGVEADYYFFAGYDFMFEQPACGKDLKYNAETFIHETGHILGLDDYYDYDSTVGPDGGIGGGDMMDYNVGDHNPFSKMILGWVTPYVVSNTSGTVSLASFGASGDCLLICKNWNGTYFDEYYVVDYYTPDGLNAFEAGYSGLFKVSGIRIYHVDATLTTKEVYSIWEVYQSNNSDTTHKLISLVQASGSNSIESENAYGSDSDLFKVGTSFTNAKWYDSTACNFNLTFDKVENNKAVVTITF